MVVHKKSKQNLFAFDTQGTIVATSGDDKKVKLWNVEKKYITTSYDLQSPCTALKYANNTFLIAVGSLDGKVKVLSTSPALKLWLDLPHLHSE
jgi:WD40 repeat protein